LAAPPLVEEVAQRPLPVEPGEERARVETKATDRLGFDTLAALAAQPAVAYAPEPLVEPGEERARVETKATDRLGFDTLAAQPAVAYAPEPLVEPGEERARVETKVSSTDAPRDLCSRSCTRCHGGMPWTYIVECADGSFYVGSTWDLERRISEHNEGLGAAYTKRRRPVVLVWAADFERVDEAYAYEKRLQGWRREKRIALIEGREADLPGLARGYWRRPPRPEP
jgi:putative endonuclease